MSKYFLHLLYKIQRVTHTGARRKKERKKERKKDVLVLKKEAAVVDTAAAHNDIRLHEIQAAVTADQEAFRKISAVRVYRARSRRSSDMVQEADSAQVRVCYCDASSYHRSEGTVEEPRWAAVHWSHRQCWCPLPHTEELCGHL